LGQGCWNDVMRIGVLKRLCPKKMDSGRVVAVKREDMDWQWVMDGKCGIAKRS
jgi:hypothetical protein